jgi:uncharacterized protein YndB with AHSA1/START domain
MTELLTVNEYGVVSEPRALRFERLLPGPIERVWAYLTEPEMRAKWLASGPMELFAGGKVELSFRHADLSPVKEERPKPFKEEEHLSGRVTRCDPPRLLAMTWGTAPDASEVTFELAPRDEEVLLVVTHRKLANRTEMINVAGGWHTHLAILTDQANGRTPRPFWSTWTGIKDEYQRRLPPEE